MTSVCHCGVWCWDAESICFPSPECYQLWVYLSVEEVWEVVENGVHLRESRELHSQGWTLLAVCVLITDSNRFSSVCRQHGWYVSPASEFTPSSGPYLFHMFSQSAFTDNTEKNPPSIGFGQEFCSESSLNRIWCQVVAVNIQMDVSLWQSSALTILFGVRNFPWVW